MAPIGPFFNLLDAFTIARLLKITLVVFVSVRATLYRLFESRFAGSAHIAVSAPPAGGSLLYQERTDLDRTEPALCALPAKRDSRRR